METYSQKPTQSPTVTLNVVAKMQQPEQMAPPAQWMRLRYSKQGPARYTSIRDFCRAFERALRRAQIPMAFSSGFNPHPRISYANSVSTGYASQAEYLEIGLSQVCDPQKIMQALNQTLPGGLKIEQAVAGREGFTNLTGSRYHISLQLDSESITDASHVLAHAVATFLDQETVEVTRETKKGLRSFDVRQAVKDLSIHPKHPSQLILLLEHGTPSVRATDVLTGLRIVCPDLVLAAPAAVERVEQGILEGKKILDPLQ